MFLKPPRSMTQDGSLDFKLVQRVCALQQALDQALYSLEEMRAQLQDQQWLESQLAKTEKYANVQQQAIAYLKSQLTQITDSQRHLLHLMGIHLEEWVGSQQVALNRLNLQIEQGEAELQSFLHHIRTQSPNWQTLGTASEANRMDLEAEVMIARSATISLGSQLQAARQHIFTLGSVLNHHHADIVQLTTALQLMLDALSEEVADEEISSVEIVPALPPADEACMLRHTVRVQQVRIHELETSLADQFGRQTQLKQRCQTLAAERDYYKRQVEHLQQQAQSAPSPALGWTEEKGLAPPPWQRRLQFQSPPPIQPLQVDEVPRGVNQIIPKG